MRTIRRSWRALIPVVAMLAACSTLTADQWDSRYGRPDPGRYDEAAAPGPHAVPYAEVQDILNRRCVVCHGCYDAPCQLKLSAWEGVARGASPERVYDGARLLNTAPTRLFEDAFGASAWRRRGFHAVLNERPGVDDVTGSLLAQMLLLKQRSPLPAGPLLPGSFDVSIDRAQRCTAIEGYADFAARYPLWGMPFGLPQIADAERERLLRWIAAGAPRAPDPPAEPLIARQIERWESWFNADDPKRQLVARFLYEHLFLADLHYGDDLHYFRLVRSRTPPGVPVERIATRRPFDDPGVARPYYRIEPLRETVLLKSHLPYRLDDSRLARWQRWFVDAPFTVTALPGYRAEVAANPFVAFAPIPVVSRFRFLLDEAQFTVMGFIKGPVCKGQQAVDVIDDHFWVFFANPTAMDERDQELFLAQNSANLRLPVEYESNVPVVRHWLGYAEAQKRYLDDRVTFSREHHMPILPPGKNLIWDGRDEDGGGNPNAALTVFRHYDNATVEQGLIGERPQTAWIITYPLLERLHYLLVAGYDVYGNVAHQLKSRLYMDFLRIEGEQNFLSLLPEDAHRALELRWYREAPRWTLDFVAASHLPAGERLEVGMEGMAPDLAFDALLARLRDRIGPALSHRHDLPDGLDPDLREKLHDLAAVRGSSLQWLPQMTLLRVERQQAGPLWLTVLNNSAHKNVAEIFFEDRRRVPAEDTLTVAHGFVGAYPNAFWSVRAEDLPQLTRRVAALDGESSYAALLDRYGMRRTDPRFWAFSDEVHEAMREADRVAFGLLDYNRLENR